MIIPSTIFGLSMIGFALLTERYPSMISGYNTMTKVQKANVDIKAYATLLRRYMVGAGVLTIITPIVLRLVGLAEYTLLALIYPTLIALLIATIRLQRFDHNKRSWFERYISTIIIGATTIFISIALVRSSTPATITIEEITS